MNILSKDKFYYLQICKEIFNLLSVKRKKHLFLLVGLIFLTGIFECLTIFFAYPLLDSITNPQTILDNKILFGLFSFFNIYDNKLIIISSALIFMGFVFFASALRIISLYFNRSFTSKVGSELSKKLFKSILNKEYQFFLENNSSKYISIISNQLNQVVELIYNVLRILLSTSIAFSIIIILLITIKNEMFLILFVLIIIYGSLNSFTKNKFRKNSKIISSYSEKQVKILNEGFGSIKDIILDKSSNFYINRLMNVDIPMRKSISDSLFMGEYPKYLIESIGLFTLSFLVIISVNQSNSQISNLITTIGILALAAQKLLPLINSIYYSYSFIRTTEASFINIINLVKSKSNLDLGNYDYKNISNFSSINFLNINFRYPRSSKNAVDNFSFNIEQGQKIGIIGETGSGKTTILDIMMGLLEPKSGEIYIDDYRIFNKGDKISKLNLLHELIGHVPQDIFLSDISLIENIANTSNQEKIDFNKIEEIMKVVELTEFVSKLPDGYKTLLGEKGARISGGQKQRIGIARALYKRKAILVLDEATSSLDLKTEKKVINNIMKYQRNISTIMVAHRLSTLENCDVIFEVKNGAIINYLSPKEL